MRPFKFFIIALLLFAPHVQAGPFLLAPGTIKIISDFSWSRSDRIFDQNGDLHKFNSNSGNRNPFSKNEGSIDVEAGAFSFLTFIGNVSGGRQEFFENGRLDWVSMEAGARIQLYQKFVTVSLENSYGYRREKISNDSIKEDGGFVDMTLLAGLPWRFNRHVSGFFSAAFGWQSHHQDLEQDILLGKAGFGIDLSQSLLGRRSLLLGEFFANAEISGAREQRTVEYKIQPSIVIFPLDFLGIQAGARWQAAGENSERSVTGVIKIWLEF